MGHYLPGLAGLGNGSPPPRGVAVTYLPFVNYFRAYKGSDGEDLQTGSTLSAVHHLEALIGTKKKLIGASYAWGAVATFVNVRLTGATLTPTERFGGVSDTVFVPMILGWEQPKVDIVARYIVVAPTGQFDPKSDANAGLGFWTHMPQFGTSFGFDEARTWNGTFLTTWEFHHKKRGLDMTVGPALTAEYAFGRKFANGLINIGAAGFVYQKLAADSGTAVDPSVRGRRDRMFGLGPEIHFEIPRMQTAFFARFQPQFGVRDRLQANAFVAGVTYLGWAK